MAVICLFLLTLVFGVADFLKGGVEPEQWFYCLAALGLTGIAYWSLTRKTDLAPPPSRTLRGLLAALLAVCVFQLLPLPIGLVRLLSPMRAEVHDALAPVLGASRFTTLTLVPAETLRLTLTVAGYVLVFLLVRELAWRWTDRQWVLVVPFVAVALLEALLGLVQHFVAGLPIAKGTYVNRDHFSGLLEMVLPFAVMAAVAALRADSPHRRGKAPAGPALKACLWLTVATVLLLGIIYSASRMGFMAALAALFVMGSLSLGSGLPGKRRWLPVAAVGLLVAVGFIFLPTDLLIQRFAAIAASDEITDIQRAKIWEDTTHLVRDYPLFGSGLGGYESAFYRYKSVAPTNTVEFAHNDYLQLLAETGVVGFAVLMLLALRLFGKALAGSAQPPGTPGRYLGIAAVGALTAIALHSLVDFNLYIPANAMLLVWIAGLVEGLEFAGPAPRHRRAPAYLESTARVVR